MDKLRSEQDKLCASLSRDPDYILSQCSGIISMDDFKEVQKQISALGKMRVLLKIIINKGADSSQSFVDILRQNQGHYQQPPGSSTPKLFADDNSVVTARDITNTTAKSLSFKIETVSSPGSSPSGNLVGQVPPADYTARGGSAICVDTLSGVTIDGNIDFSVSVKSSQVHADMVDDTLHTPQGPAGKVIMDHKVKLIDCLRADLFILQHVHEKRIVTDRQYQNLKHISPPERTVTNLIDLVTSNGEEACVEFLQILKEPEVLGTYPQLKEIRDI